MQVVDSHAHIVDPDYGFANNPGYRPLPHEIGNLDDFVDTLDAHSITHAVLVQPSAYGYDNRAMLAALARGNDRFKGIAAVPPDVSTAELNHLVDARVVGVRFNILDYEPRSLADHTMAPLLEKLRELNLCVQLHASGDLLARSAQQLVERNIRCVIDHCGRPDVRLGVEHPAFRSLLELGGSKALFVKLSGPFRVSLESDPYADLDAYYAALIGAFTLERCVWGSDWPFLGIAPRPEYARILNGLDRWVPNACDRRLVLWDTPARLFGFT